MAGLVVAVALLVLAIGAQTTVSLLCHLRTQEYLDWLTDQFEISLRESQAVTLRGAADEMSTAKGQGELMKIARTSYKPGGPSVANLWLREKAEKLFPETEESER